MTRARLSGGRTFAHVIGFALALVATGCGGGQKTGDVVGKVTLNGKAPNLDGLAINFLGPNGRPVTAPVASDGTYRASGVAEGANKVAFAVGSVEDANAKLKGMKPTAGGDIDKEKMAALVKAQEASGAGPKSIPPKFLDVNQSQLSTNVNAGQDNSFNVDIK